MRTDLCAFLPKARSEGIISKEIDGELLIYDRARDRAHCLNETAATIWNLCDGRSSVREISERWAMSWRHKGEVARKVEAGSGIDQIVPSNEEREQFEQVVRLAMDRLRRAHLLEKTNHKTFTAPISEMANISRREAVRRISFGAAIAIPVVTAITAPTPAEAAASCGIHCDPCSSPIECCGTCSTSVPGCSGLPRCT